LTTLFEFRWDVDQDGYDLVHISIPAIKTATGVALIAGAGFDYDVIRARGGPRREYRPMQKYEDLWRRFAACADVNQLLEFIGEFGLLYSLPESPNDRNVSRYDTLHDPNQLLIEAAFARQLAELVDAKRYTESSVLWNERARPKLSAQLLPTRRFERFEFKPVPLDLASAILLQAGEAIALNQEWRRCQNDGCHNSFRIGVGSYTTRRVFCSDNCRVAAAQRKAKQNGKTSAR
jgi:hypothetical protein